jgi:hypothetical protein
MKARYQREIEFREALQKLYPQMSRADALMAAQRFAKARGFSVEPHALYCAAASLARHAYTNYDELCQTVEKESARAAVRPSERAKLREWGGPERDPG